MRNPDYTDVQVLTLIRAHPGRNVYQLHKIARIEMPNTSWSTGKIHKAIQRLKKEEKIVGKIRVNGAKTCQELYSRI